ncbi:MAG: sulfatase-like hydrolase/transferase, partial [Bacteroidales bacterium]
PLQVGFDKNVAGHAAGAMGSYLGEKSFGNDRKDAATWGVPHLDTYHGKDIFLTEALTQEATKLMDEALNQEKPFFLYMAHYAVHAPFEADKRYYQKYIDAGLEEQEARFASIVEGMDKSLGDIVRYTEEKGIADNTIILFMSDNGGYSVGVRSNTFGGVNKNAPLRGGKGSLYQGGIREPMIVYAPGITKPNSINNSPVMIEDYFQTILDLAQIKKYDCVQETDSKSFVQALKGKSINKKRPLYWHYPNDWGERGNECGAPSSAVISGDLKLIHYYESGKNELFNIRTDIGERNNLLLSGDLYKKEAQKLAKLLSDQLRRTSSPMPVNKQTGERVPYPDQTI